MKKLLVLGVLATVGCGSDGFPNIEGRQTITQGLYGQLINGCDTQDCRISPAEGTPVFVFGARPTKATQSFLATTSSIQDGLFQLELPAATYTLCRGYFNDQPSVMKYAFGPCVETTVVTQQRHDWASGPGGGHWHPGENFGPE